MRSSSITKDQSILIIDPDADFREALYNFLLSAGYERVDSADDYQNALEKIKETEYDVLLLDAGSSPGGGLDAANALAAAYPKIEVILMVGAREQNEPTNENENRGDYQYLIKATFARNLLYLLDNSE